MSNFVGGSVTSNDNRNVAPNVLNVDIIIALIMVRDTPHDPIVIATTGMIPTTRSATTLAETSHPGKHGNAMALMTT